MNTTVQEYGRLKTLVFTWVKGAAPVNLEFNIQTKFLIQNIICPEVALNIESDFARKNMQPYELAVRSAGNSDYLYDQKNINDAGNRTLTGLSLVDLNTAADSIKCVVIVVYLEFQN